MIYRKIKKYGSNHKKNNFQTRSWLKQKNKELLLNNKHLAEMNAHLLQQIKKCNEDKENSEKESMFQFFLAQKTFIEKIQQIKQQISFHRNQMNNYFNVMISSLDFIAKEESNRFSFMNLKKSAAFDDFLNEIYQNESIPLKSDSKSFQKSSTDKKTVCDFENTLSNITEISDENISIENNFISNSKRKSSRISFATPSIMKYTPESPEKDSDSSSSTSIHSIHKPSTLNYSKSLSITPSIIKFTPESPKEGDSNSYHLAFIDSFSELRESPVKFSTPSVIKMIPESSLKVKNKSYTDTSFESTIVFQNPNKVQKTSLSSPNVSNISASHKINNFETQISFNTIKQTDHKKSLLNSAETPQILSSTKINSTSKKTTKKKKRRRKLENMFYPTSLLENNDTIVEKKVLEKHDSQQRISESDSMKENESISFRRSLRGQRKISYKEPSTARKLRSGDSEWCHSNR